VQNRDNLNSELDYIIGEHNRNVGELKIFIGDRIFLSSELKTIFSEQKTSYSEAFFTPR